MLLLNLLLAAAWSIFQRSFAPTDFLTGFALGFIIIAITEYVSGQGRYSRRSWRVIELAIITCADMVRANIMLISLITAPETQMRPGIVAIPLDVRTDAAVVTLVYLLNLMPGTLSLDIASSKRILYVHTIHVSNANAFRRNVKHELESRVAEIWGEW